MAEGKLPLPFNLPVGALVLVFPMIAALTLVYAKHGWSGVKQLLKRILDFQRIKSKIWYLPIFFLMPGLMLLEYGLLRFMGTPVPNLQFPVLMLPAFFVLFFLGAIGEELGWTGYATEPLQERFTALEAAAILGTVWMVWHATSLAQTGNPPLWVAAQSATNIPLRVLIVWIYNNAGKSLFAAIAFHASVNVGELVLFPVYGSYYDPVIAFVLLAASAATVILLWGAKTLGRFRYARQPVQGSRAQS